MVSVGDARAGDATQAARSRMVEEQIAGRGVTDARVLAAMRRVPRHLVPGAGLLLRTPGVAGMHRQAWQ